MRIPLVFVKIFNYEYWPWWMFYLPLAPYWLYLAIKARSLSFFTNANPAIEASGFYGEKKIDILKLIPSQYLAKTIFIQKETSVDVVFNQLKINNLYYPIIVKPNVGERGFMVVKIENETQLANYNQQIEADYIIQEFVDFEVELGVLYSKLPENEKGEVSSVTRKEFLTVRGDGVSTVLDLIQQSNRARFQLDALQQKMGDGINTVLPKDKSLLLEPIGNHCRGTKFLNNNYLINPKLNEVFNQIAEGIEDFHYGRFDMRVKSIEDLYEGKNIKILELNGISSDPGHIYDPHYKLWKAYRDLAWHWHRLAEISIQNRKRGIEPISVSEIFKIIKTHFL